MVKICICNQEVSNVFTICRVNGTLAQCTGSAADSDLISPEDVRNPAGGRIIAPDTSGPFHIEIKNDSQMNEEKRNMDF